MNEKYVTYFIVLNSFVLNLLTFFKNSTTVSGTDLRQVYSQRASDAISTRFFLTQTEFMIFRRIFASKTPKILKYSHKNEGF